MLVRLGQHTGFDTNALANVTPWSTSMLVTFFIDQSVSQRWSSVRMRTMFGLWAPPWAEARRATGAGQAARSRRASRTGPNRRADRAEVIRPTVPRGRGGGEAPKALVETPRP